MVRDGPQPVVLTYYLYQAADSVGFIWPIFTLFLLWNDLTYTQIGTLSALSAILVVSLELPTGYVADRYGRRTALAIGMTAMAVSTAGFVVADTFLEFAALYALWALSMALQSGTADAWLYDALRGAVDDRSFTHVRGRGGSVYQWMSAVTMVAGGFLYVVHPTYPFVASALLNAVGVLIVLAMPRNPRFESSTGDDRVGVRESVSILTTQFATPALRVFVVYVALFFGVVHAADEYIQPITVDVVEARVGDVLSSPELAGLPIQAETTLGFVYAGFAVVAAVASYHAETVRRHVGLRRALVALPVCVAAAFLLPLVFPLLAIPVFFAMKGGAELVTPLVAQYVNDRTGETSRATVLSTISMAKAGVRAPLMPLAGLVADVASPITAVGTLGGGFLTVAVLIIAVASPVVIDASGRPQDEA
ncbi:MFS transporter [Natronobacterium texcoconense]|uniref:Major Facilitator Superfamily protein n=1 Tax=Natronobacterium texcoconense TaxID=1095778 RepID=A0A1H1IDJ1_NATTX|nr:MFS transporter [Natronobacterium texcoconense]SDR35757.1 Major Facilitator Superfamily protein [Natronobacterium texcoconense]